MYFLHNFFSETELGSEAKKDFEIFLVAKILYRLGYWGGNRETKVIIESPISKETLSFVSANRPLFLNEVNRAIKESHL